MADKKISQLPENISPPALGLVEIENVLGVSEHVKIENLLATVSSNKPVMAHFDASAFGNVSYLIADTTIPADSVSTGQTVRGYVVRGAGSSFTAGGTGRIYIDIDGGLELEAFINGGTTAGDRYSFFVMNLGSGNARVWLETVDQSGTVYATEEVDISIDFSADFDIGVRSNIVGAFMNHALSKIAYPIWD